MHLGIRSEQSLRERRVAATPTSVASFIDLGFRVSVVSGAGEPSGFADAAFAEAGATVVEAVLPSDPLDILLCVAPPTDTAVSAVASGGIVIGHLDPGANAGRIAQWSERSITPIAMELVPRSTLAQAMDSLSSQATAAGYAAVLLGATELPKFMPMLVTAAGTVPPARVLILGVGVAGLQAIATARRLGAVVHAYDIRPETKEQVESLGAKFVDAPTQKMDDGGYARAVDEETAAKQREVLASAVAQSDLIITTAQVPGRTAPRLIDRSMIDGMKHGSLIIDMAASSGGNVEGSEPDKEARIGGVRILGPTDLAARVASDASRMYARNLLEMVKRLVVDGAIVVDTGDAVIGPAIVPADDPAEADPGATE
jgi:NAD(P) transhydrogenase subunit alpha